MICLKSFTWCGKRKLFRIQFWLASQELEEIKIGIWVIICQGIWWWHHIIIIITEGFWLIVSTKRERSEVGNCYMLVVIVLHLRTVKREEDWFISVDTMRMQFSLGIGFFMNRPSLIFFMHIIIIYSKNCEIIQQHFLEFLWFLFPWWMF